MIHILANEPRKASKNSAGAQVLAGSREQRSATVRAGVEDVDAKAIAYAEKNVQGTRI